MISVKPCTDEFPKVKDQQIVTDGVNCMIAGNYLSPIYLEEIRNMELKETDILLATYTRSGTTITRRLLLVMMYGPDRVLNTEKNEMDEISPFLEFQDFQTGYFGYHCAKKLQDAPQRLLKTHLPIWLAPKSEKAKKVIVARDVKDTLVSTYYFYKNDSNNPKEIYNSLEFETFYKMFMSGAILYGDWYQWYRGWLDASDENTLLLHYEDFIRNFEETVTKLAKFVGVEMTSELMSKLKEAVDFKRMKKELSVPSMKDFVRKGVIGDHQNYLDEEQIKFLNEKCQEIVPELLK
ncbi:cytosolic sulfotransferase 3-like [Hydractinia symbiolongicarpus]|uniref:cytosolic sulfotransferase 3-like n=1 Tax=Hydractinia symbiolongicarpus TaxID=13093 RepID=UPI0025506EAF|nr:cytosolic sulfotransferase 3-like [Hydractinia symbiolongicarpus]XP_057289840.1 cytosolic sulfotransferase 3-like [Hydractinia symbiolongicarpus]XP_057289841.1 cytosolic sulfotransferase 3-like [Hydractinia symbiolongicarpus]